MNTIVDKIIKSRQLSLNQINRNIKKKKKTWYNEIESASVVKIMMINLVRMKIRMRKAIDEEQRSIIMMIISLQIQKNNKNPKKPMNLDKSKKRNDHE